MLLQLPSLWDFPRSHQALLRAWAPAGGLVPSLLMVAFFICVMFVMARASVSPNRRILGAFCGSPTTTTLLLLSSSWIRS